MAQQGEINQNQNITGLFTEGSPLNFPPGATVRDENFILNTDGSRERRFGIGKEINAQFNGTKYIFGRTHVFDWDGVGNDGSKNYAVIFNNGRINFYDKSVEPLSKGFITQFSAFYAKGEELVGAASINGEFVLAGDDASDFMVFYLENGTIKRKRYNIKVRDIWGVDSDRAVDERYETLGNEERHSYNLPNQGWSLAAAKEVEQATGKWPSNADVFTYGVADSGSDRFLAGLYIVPPFGTTPAPKGSAVVELTNMLQGRLDHLTKRGFFNNDPSVLNDYVDTAPKAVVGYAGRVFFAGFVNPENPANETYPNLASTVVFSRTVQSRDDISKCYQEQDPTSRDPDILASDGGTITISGTGYIYKLISSGRSLLIFASEGVWELYSTDNIFSADNYQIRKLTDVGCKSARSVVLVENTPMYWTDYGIYILQPDQVSESFVARNITQESIQTFFDEIDASSTREAFGFYDEFDKKVRWLYSSDGSNVLNYDRELIFDSRLQSWYTNTYPLIQGNILSGMVQLNSFSEAEVANNIVVGSDNVLAGTDEVVTLQMVPDKGRRSFKYISLNSVDGDHEFLEFNQPNFKDYGTVDAEAVMITGPYTGGDTVRRKSSTYLTMQLRKTETGFKLDPDGNIIPENPGSCLVQTRWDWTDLSKAGKWNPVIEMYRHRRHYIPNDVTDDYEDGYPVVTTKSRLRGSGRSIAIKITSSPEKDLNILGWNFQMSVNEKV